ncbi:unnamed protein product [Ostreobium quekettii]|uniref:Uncharacterized protein n=1 Tax=Ostreobium quekettii TaxID=121088 RepID=A0A8S1IY22_9CHLO|nr:unnamed protein product [Ostreobium quekettii]|eukprot:evm.model.scf_270.5 EVM.evm.TU.scf_270.5   scf_270:70966-74284(+)
MQRGVHPGRRLEGFRSVLSSAMGVAFCGGSSPRRSIDCEPLPSLVLIEPPCLVAGEKSSVDVRLSWAMLPEDRMQMEVTGSNGCIEKARFMSKQGDAMSLSIPPVKCGGVCLDFELAEHGAKGPTANLLALPKCPAEEMCGLFSKLMSEIQTIRAQREFNLPFAHFHQESRDEQMLKEALWTSYFRILCSDFASMLDGLRCGDERMQAKCPALVKYFLANQMWATASFLMKAAAASRAKISGPRVRFLGGENLASKMASKIGKKNFLDTKDGVGAQAWMKGRCRAAPLRWEFQQTGA